MATVKHYRGYVPPRHVPGLLSWLAQGRGKYFSDRADGSRQSHARPGAGVFSYKPHFGLSVVDVGSKMVLLEKRLKLLV